MSESEILRPEPQFAAFVGIDWADQKHAWCLQAAGGMQRESGEVEHTRRKRSRPGWGSFVNDSPIAPSRSRWNK
jgi:hypothetical protein